MEEFEIDTRNMQARYLQVGDVLLGMGTVVKYNGQHEYEYGWAVDVIVKLEDGTKLPMAFPASAEVALIV